MDRGTLIKILNLARWSPSGDNSQPWRFEIVDDLHVRVHGFDTRENVLYDFDGHASHMAHGALLETIRIAASGFGMLANWTISSAAGDKTPMYLVSFNSSPAAAECALYESIERRTVQRRPMHTNALTFVQRQALIKAAGEGFEVRLFTEPMQRLRIAKILWNSAKIRLTCAEAYPVHREIIEWRARFSKDRIPEEALGVDPLTARLMEWVMGSWDRVQFFNKYLLGTVAPRIQLDFLPGFFCSAHLLVCPYKAPAQLADWIKLGGAMQRIWLTATAHGLHLQPEMTPLIFRWYARAGRRFSAQPRLFGQACQVAISLEQIARGSSTDTFGFLARVGVSKVPQSRSIRLDLDSLMK